PENILLLCQDNREDFVKILDFGIAKVLDAPSLTGSQQIFGTPGYIAPEYIQSTEIDGRADLYSLGVLLYEMSTGALPFNYRYSSDLLIKHVTETPIPPRRRYPSVEEPLDAFILRCLNKDPNERFQDAYHFLEELARVNELLSSEPPDDRCSPNRPTSEVETNVRRDAFEQIRTTSETGEVESERIEALTVRGVSENSLHSDLGFSTWRERYELMRNLLLRCRTPYPERVEEDLHALEILFAEAHQSVSAARSASEELAVVELLRRERLLALGQTVDDLGAELSRSRRELEIRSRERELLLPDELGHTGCLKTSVESCLSDQAIRELELRIDELEVQLARRHRELEKSQLKWERERTKFAKRIASHTSHCEQRSLELQAALERTEAHLGSLHAKGRISTTSIEALRKEQLLSKIEDDL
ncbi:MAG: protein kinase, partial [Myxococcota bacterium]